MKTVEEVAQAFSHYKSFNNEIIRNTKPSFLAYLSYNCKYLMTSFSSIDELTKLCNLPQELIEFAINNPIEFEENYQTKLQDLSELKQGLDVGNYDKRFKEALIKAIANLNLPIWHEKVRAVPNGILRSALFGAIRKGRRKYLKEELLSSVDGVEIRYTGERLDQTDLTVWETILHIARKQNLGSVCRISSYELLKIMGKSISGKNRLVLRSNILRMKANAVIIKQDKREYFGSLIDKALKNEQDEWLITINSDLRSLFSKNDYTKIEWKVRQALEGQQLAQWLHGFYSTHAKPYPIKLETLKNLSGSEAGELKIFVQKLKKALQALAEISQANGHIFKYEIKDGLLYIDKSGSAAQQRYMTIN